MSSKDNRLYHSRRPLKIIITTLLAIIAAIIIIVVSVYFGFQKYIVYDDDGIHLEVPWLEEAPESYSSDTDLA